MPCEKPLVTICGLKHLWIVLTSVLYCSGQTAYEPGFLGPLKNVTVVQGKDASFTCMVDNLGNHRIAWIKVDSKAILAIQDLVITNNARLSVHMNDKVTWTLHIKSVQPSDAGRYMCQVNTEPMRNQLASLDVVVPPDIISEDTTGDVMVPEGGMAKLVCKAKGTPRPTITWRKEDGSAIIIKEHHGGGKRKVKTFEGEMLNLTKIVRSEMGAYFCIASNGVPPSVSKRVLVSVHFHPLIQVPNQMVAAPKGIDITIECTSEASPKAINYWTRESGEMIISNDKFNMTEEPISQYGVRMRLQIRILAPRDFTGYKCISQNSMGNTEGVIHIHEIRFSGDKLPPPADSMYSGGDDEDNYGGGGGSGRNHHHHGHHEGSSRRGESGSIHSTRIPLVESFHPIDTPIVANEGSNNHPVIQPTLLMFTFLLTILLHRLFGDLISPPFPLH